MEPSRVVLLSGSVLPAEPARRAARRAGDVDAVAKDLEVYATDAPPPDFMRLQVRAEVTLSAPPDGEPPPWMRKRPGGTAAVTQTFRTYDPDQEALRGPAGAWSQ